MLRKFNGLNCGKSWLEQELLVWVTRNHFSLEITSFYGCFGGFNLGSPPSLESKLELYFVSQLCSLCYEVALTVLYEGQPPIFGNISWPAVTGGHPQLMQPLLFIVSNYPEFCNNFPENMSTFLSDCDLCCLALFCSCMVLFF